MGQKKVLPKAQNSTPVTPQANDITAIEHEVDLKYLKFERSKLSSKYPQQTLPVQPPEPTTAPHDSADPPPPPKKTPVQPVTASESSPQDDGEAESSGEEPLEIFETFEDDQFKEPPQKVERQPVEPSKVRRRLSLRRQFQQTEKHVEQKKEEEPRVTETQDPKGQLVFSKDTGEKLGVITDIVYDGHHSIVGYKIQTGSAKTTFSYPVEQFAKGKKGLLFIPNWYRNAIETIERLEFLDKVSPELPGLVQNGMFNEELFDLLLKRDEKFSEYLNQAIELKELLLLQIQLLEERRQTLSEKANTLMVKRVMDEIDRNTFAENVQVLRRKIQLLDLNIKQCTKLLQRLNYTSAGVITDHFVESVEPPKDELPRTVRTSGKKPQSHSEAGLRDSEPSFTELIAELVEEKIMADIRRQLTQEKMPRQYPHPHDDTEGYPPTRSFDKDDEKK